MLPLNASSVGALQLPNLPPVPSGPNPTAPGAFGSLYDNLLSVGDTPGKRGLPQAMEIAPIMTGPDGISSTEFPGAVDPNQLLQPESPAATAQDGQAQGNLTEFLSPLKKGLGEVSDLQNKADGLANEAAIGGDVDLHDVMIAAEKAGVSLQLATQIRNKLVEGYQEVMRMQV